jgi:hypothetical protein
LQNAQAMVKQLQLQADTEAAEARQESDRHQDLLRRSEQLVEEQQASQEEGVARMQRAGEKQKGGSALAEPRHQSESTEEQRSNAASSQGSAASRRKTGRCLSSELLAWLKRHDLKGVHECDKNGWSALHHVAMDSKSETAVKGIFHELCNYEWSPMELDAETGEAPRSTHLPIGWTALHLLANGREYGRQRGQMAQRLLDMHANPMTLTARLTSPLHTAAGTGNIDVTKALLLHPGTDVNWKNKDNKTPYDTACSNRACRKLIEDAGGIASSDLTGQTARDEPNARKRGAPPSDLRWLRAAQWQRRRL